MRHRRDLGRGRRVRRRHTRARTALRHHVPGACTDRAGNSAAGPSRSIRRHRTRGDGVTPDRAAQRRRLVQPPGRVRGSAAPTPSQGSAAARSRLRRARQPRPSVPGTCTDAAGNVSAPHAHPLKYDATAPRSRPRCRPPARCDGWYNRAVSIAFQGTDETSGVDECTTTTYAGPDTAARHRSRVLPATRPGTLSGTLDFDAQVRRHGRRWSPVQRADRDPNRGGWYVSPVRVSASPGRTRCRS